MSPQGGLVWRNGDLNTLETTIRLRMKDLQEGALQALAESVNEGSTVMHNVIEDSVTPTGEERARRGAGVPGRIDTQAMYNDVHSGASDEGNGVLVGTLGWQRDPEGYYAKQEYGSGKIAPMHALLQGFITAREVLTIRLTRLARGKK